MASKNRRNKTKFKWNAPLIVLIVAIVAMIGVAVALSFPTKAEKNLSKYNDAITEYNTSNNAQYQTLVDKNIVYKEVSYETLSTKINDGLVIVLYGSLKEAEILGNLYDINERAKKLEIKTIYILSSNWYVDGDQEDTKFKKDVKERQNTLTGKRTEELGNLDVEEIDFSKHPAIWCYTDGALMFNSQQYTSFTWENYKAKVFSIANEYTNKAKA